MEKTDRWHVFLNAVFFVLGFSVIFALLGVLLQTLLESSSLMVQKWLARIGGVFIILFGLYLLGLIKPKFLEREYKIHVNQKFSSSYIASFVFGAAFAVGWSPCVGAVLGAVLTLAVTEPGMAFFLLLAYALGLGVPFLIVGLFTDRAAKLIPKTAAWVKWVTYGFGILLILIGVFIFTDQLGRLANFQFATDLLLSLEGVTASSFQSLNLGVAFVAGLVSFLSPCVLPIVPGFLTYLASLGVKK